jgi:hypothetical protein
MLEKTLAAANPSWPLVLTAGPAVVVLLFFAAYALTGGVHGLLFLFRYKLAPAKSDALISAQQAAAVTMGGPFPSSVPPPPNEVQRAESLRDL